MIMINVYILAWAQDLTRSNLVDLYKVDLHNEDQHLSGF